MRNYFAVSLLLAGTVMTANAQDIITKKNGDEIKAKVLEIGQTEVKYKKFGYETGPTYTLSKADIFMVKYENGDKDLFNEPVATAAVEEVKQEVAVKTAPVATRPKATTTTPRTVQTRTQTAAQPAATTEPAPEMLIYPDRKGWIGGGIGAAIPLGNVTDADFGTGALFSINFGYLFSQNVGIYATVLGTAFPYAHGDASLGISGFWVGPLFTAPVTPTGKVEFDFKPLLGTVKATLTIDDESGNSKSTFSFGAGVSLRFNLTTRFSLSGNIDYINAKFDKDTFHINYEDADLSTLGISIGAAYRF